MTQVIIYTDFDGTITSRAGGKCVFTPFYQSLLVGYQEGKINQDYKRTTMVEPQQIQALFEKKFGLYDEHFNYQQADSDMLMSFAAVAFFHEALNNEHIQIRVVTKNRKDYIEALLTYQGFSPQEISKLIIFDSGLKYQSVFADLSAQHHINDAHIYILDDCKEDFLAMSGAVQDVAQQVTPIKEEQIHRELKQPGQFEWAHYQQEIIALTSPHTSTTETAADSVAQTTSTTIDSSEVVTLNAPGTVASSPSKEQRDEGLTPCSHFDGKGLQHGSSDLNSDESSPPSPSVIIENQPIVKEATNNSQYRTLKITSLSSALGLMAGALLGGILIATGVFFIFRGSSLLSVGSTSVAGVIGYVAAIATDESERKPLARQDAEQNNALRLLGEPTSPPDSNTVAPQNFAQLFPEASPVTKQELTSQESLTFS